MGISNAQSYITCSHCNCISVSGWDLERKTKFDFVTHPIPHFHPNNDACWILSSDRFASPGLPFFNFSLANELQVLVTVCHSTDAQL